MIDIFCRANHAKTVPTCAECDELLNYAMARLDYCPFGEEKTSCAKCPVHCYNAAMQARIKQVMRFAGPRMPLRHPILALLHTLH